MVNTSKNNVFSIALVGPTAIGKTRLSVDLAKEFNCEIVGVDSMQVYKFMDIGTAKITREEMEGIPHHLIDIVYPDEQYDAARFVKDAREAIEKIAKKGRTPLLTGGTGLYLKAFTEGLFEDIKVDREVRDSLKKRLQAEGSEKLHDELAVCDKLSAERIHVNDAYRIVRALEIYHSTGTPWSVHIENHKKQNRVESSDIVIVGLTCERAKLYERINLRTRIMLDSGLEQEVKSLIERGYGPELKSMSSIGYRHMCQYLAGDIASEELYESLARDTRRYAKRQYTWFNKVDGLDWFEVFEDDAIKKHIAKKLAN